MNITHSRVEFWGACPATTDAAYRWIERAARTCYNSEDKITSDSARPFIERILKPKPAHSSVLEHSNIVLRSKELKHPVKEAENQKIRIHSNFIFVEAYKGRVYIYGNYRAFMENFKIPFFELSKTLLSPFPEYEIASYDQIPAFAQALTACFYTDRAVSHEIVRHRWKTAFSQRSQRYCNEADLQICEPYWLAKASKKERKEFLLFCAKVEDTYQYFKATGHNNQEARAVLPNCTSTV